MTDLAAANVDVNPHPEWPIEPLCCSFHYPADEVTTELARVDAEELRKPVCVDCGESFKPVAQSQRRCKWCNAVKYMS